MKAKRVDIGGMEAASAHAQGVERSQSDACVTSASKRPADDAADEHSVSVSENWIGAAIERLEDERFIRGEGRYVDDFHFADALHAVALRSPVAAGFITAIDTAAAQDEPGVVLVATAADLAAEGVSGIPWEVCPPGFEPAFPGDPAIAVPQPILADECVRYVGEIIAFVVAETYAAALRGAEAIDISFDSMDAVADAREALQPEAPQVGERGNLLFKHSTGDSAAVRLAFERADVVVEIETHVPRLVAAPIETRAYIGLFDPAIDGLTLIASAGKPHPVRNTIAKQILHIDPKALRVIAPDVGGGFGGKNVVHAEEVLVLWAARRLRRPVRWLSSRNESFLSDMQGRDHRISARLALDSQGRFLAIDYSSIVNLGAYLAPRAVVPCLSGLKILTGPYRLQAVSGTVRAVFTNTVPTCPYRGAGVPETAFVVERLVDKAARLLGMDPIEIRRRNLIRPDELPYPLPTGQMLHSVDYPSLLTVIETERDKVVVPPLAAGERHGIGIAFTIESYGTGFDESASLTFDRSGLAKLRIGTKSSGQSHETVYAQIVADALGIRPADVHVIQGDTDLIARGNGTGASRSLTIGGTAVLKASQALVDKVRPVAARLLQSEEAVLAYQRGVFRGPDGRSVTIDKAVGIMDGGTVTAEATYRPDLFNFPAGCHLTEVAVDEETGRVRILGYKAAHDSGNLLNPMVVLGQLHGGIAQGIGAALSEEVRYDPSGQILSGSFMDYGLPHAADLPNFELDHIGIPCASNPLGVKAAGEAGPVAAPPSVINAIIDALAGLGVDDIEMPATPGRIWSAIRSRSSETQLTRKSKEAPAGAYISKTSKISGEALLSE